MGLSKSANAMMAKVFCLYGKSIDESGYNALLQKRDVAEVAGYLKDGTYYAPALSEVKEELVHREQLEALVSRFVWDTYLRLSKYAYGDKALLKIYAEKSAIRQLLIAIRLLNAGEMSRFIVSMPAYLAKYMPVDLFRIAAAKTYDDFLEAIEKTQYYRILGRFRPISENGRMDVTACETALLTFHYTKALRYIGEAYDGDTKSALQTMLHHEIDLHNVTMMYRMKRYFNADSKSMAANLIAIKTRLSRVTYGMMLAAEDYSEILNIFDTARHAAAQSAKTRDGSAEQMFFMTQSITRYFSQKALRFSTKPVVVLFSYMALLEIEANNIINIIEGIRYGLAPDEIRSMIVL